MKQRVHYFYYIPDTASMPLPKPTDKDDALLLEELMNGPNQGEAGKDETDFSAQWNQVRGKST